MPQANTHQWIGSQQLPYRSDGRGEDGGIARPVRDQHPVGMKLGHEVRGGEIRQQDDLTAPPPQRVHDPRLHAAVHDSDPRAGTGQDVRLLPRHLTDEVLPLGEWNREGQGHRIRTGLVDDDPALQAVRAQMADQAACVDAGETTNAVRGEKGVEPLTG